MNTFKKTIYLSNNDKSNERNFWGIHQNEQNR